MDKEMILEAWKRAVDDLEGPEVREASETIRLFEACDPESPGHWLARGFVIGMMEGCRRMKAAN
jgi:hypothetical protein